MSISTLNDDLNILQNLAIPAFEEDVDVIQKLDDEPNDVGGLTAAELKAKFDEAGNRIKTYLNETLVPSISETVAEAEERAKAEAARVLAEEQRAAAEQERVSAEAEREQAEAERRAGEAARVSAEEERAAAETARKEAEAARALAEQNRVDTDNGIVAQATKAAEDAETAKDNAEKAAETASSAAIHQPIVGDNQNWWTWNIADGAYVDTGIYAAGHSPYIGNNGDWWIGAEDTGVAATGPQGAQGIQGIQGQAGPAGSDGQDGITPTIGDNGNWYLGDTDTGKPSRGETGPAGPAGPTGPQGPKGEIGPQGPAGPSLAVTNTASVGQTVKITAVDENGQPTEWEAVDMASGGGGTTSDEWTDLGTLTLADGEEAINFLWEVNGQVKKIHIEGVYYSATSGKNLSLLNNDGVDNYPLISFNVFPFPSSAETAMYMDLTVEELYPGYWFGCGGSSNYNTPHTNTIFSCSHPKRVDRYLSLGEYWRVTPLTAGTWFNVKVVYY